MADIIQFPQEQAAFDADVTAAMATAFDQVCAVLQLSDVPAREAVAARIIELARQGERDPALLREAVLRELGRHRDLGRSVSLM